MPTGYTAMIEEGDGCTFEEFVWLCARNFGALVLMRDHPLGARVPEKFEPSDYNAKRMEEARAELRRLDEMTPTEIDAAIKAEREEIIAVNTKYALEHRRKKERYEAMRRCVEKWKPPSPDHQGLKEFMLDQIRISMDDRPYQRELPECDPTAWLAGKKQEAQRSLAYHTTAHAEEIERTNGRNLWVQQLRESVPQPGRGSTGRDEDGGGEEEQRA